MVRRPAGVRYPDLRKAAGGQRQRLMATGQNRAVHPLDYQMVNQ